MLMGRTSDILPAFVILRRYLLRRNRNIASRKLRFVIRWCWHIVPMRKTEELSVYIRLILS